MGEMESSAVRYFESLIDRGKFSEPLMATGHVRNHNGNHVTGRRARKRTPRVQQALAFIDQGGTLKEAARRFGVSRNHLLRLRGAGGDR